MFVVLEISPGSVTTGTHGDGLPCQSLLDREPWVGRIYIEFSYIEFIYIELFQIYFLIYYITMARYNNKRRNYRRRKKSTGPNNKKQMTRIAKKVAFNMIPTKRFPNDGSTLLSSNSPNSILIKPYFIPAADALVSGHDENQRRMTNNIWINRTSGFVRILPPATCVNALDIRIVCGYYKGAGAVIGSNAGPQGTDSALSATHIYEVFASNMGRYDPSNFKIVSDRSSIHMPQQIFDVDGSGQSSTMTALWRPVERKCNMRFNRRFTYSDGKQNDDSETTSSGENVDGWKPFIWIYAKAPDQQWDQGNQCDIEYKFTTYFKDLQ